MLRFVILSLTLAAALLGGLYGVVSKGGVNFPSFALEIVLFLLVAHVAGYGFVVRQMGQRPEDFVKLYLGLTVVRILLFGIFIFAVIRIDARSAGSNAIFFLVGYLLFTTLEVGALYFAVNAGDPTKRGQKGL